MNILQGLARDIRASMPPERIALIWAGTDESSAWFFDLWSTKEKGVSRVKQDAE